MTQGTRRTADAIERWMIEHLADSLKLDPSMIDPTADLPSFSLDSIRAVELSARLSEWIGRRVPPTILWDHASIRDLAGFIASQDEDRGGDE